MNLRLAGSNSNGAKILIKSHFWLWFCFTWILDSGKAIFRATSSRINTSGYRVLLNNDSNTSSCCREYVILSRLCLFVFSPISPKLGWHLFTNSLYFLKFQVRGNDGKKQHFHDNNHMYWSHWSVKLDTPMSIDGMSFKKIPKLQIDWAFLAPLWGSGFYLNSGFGQVDLQGDFLPHKYVRVSSFTKQRL